jgi:hypothetical protein
MDNLLGPKSDRSRNIVSSVALLVPVILMMSGCTPEQAPPKMTYVDDVKPIIEARCQECHLPGQAGAEASGFVVDSYAGLMKGTRLGAVVIPGSAVSSTLFRLVSGEADPSIQMPHGKEMLTDGEIETIKVWIDQGANEY